MKKKKKREDYHWWHSTITPGLASCSSILSWIEPAKAGLHDPVHVPASSHSYWNYCVGRLHNTSTLAIGTQWQCVGSKRKRRHSDWKPGFCFCCHLFSPLVIFFSFPVSLAHKTEFTSLEKSSLACNQPVVHFQEVYECSIHFKGHEVVAPNTDATAFLHPWEAVLLPKAPRLL